jgi:type I restriction enzyme S subunit
MPFHEWQRMTLGEICDADGAMLQTGPFGSQLHSYDYQPVGIAVVPTEAIGQRRLKTDGLPRVSPETAQRLDRHKLQAGDILFARRGVQATGLSAMVRPDQEGWLCGTGAILLRFRSKAIDPAFISFALSTPTTIQWLKSHAVGAVMPNLNEGVLRNLPLLVPPLNEQRAIAQILGTLDDKIELNQRMNETLEATARTLFRSWFVDFDPVRSRVDGTKPQGTEAETVKLFPDNFEDSPLGKIPKGWKVAPLGEHVEAVKGLSYKGDGLADAGMPLHNLNSVYEGGGYKYEGIKFYTGEYKERHILRPGDVIVANTEQGHDLLLIGYPAIVPRVFGETGLFSHHLYRVRPHPSSPLTNHFIFFQLMDQRLRDEVTGHTNGTTVNMLAVDGLQRPLFVLPPAELIRAFDRVVSPIFDKAEQVHSESLELSRVRDGLLPKLLSGEVTPQ